MYVICTKKTFIGRVMATYKPAKRPILKKIPKKILAIRKLFLI